MHPEPCSTTYQCAFQWPASMPQNNHHQFSERPYTAPQNHNENVMKIPEAAKEFAKSFECGCKKHSKGETGNKKSAQPNCLHVNVIMPYQVNFSNIPAHKKKGSDGFNAYIYGSERKEALQAAAMKCTQRPEPTMRDINKKVDIKLNRPKTAPIRHDPCAAAHGSTKHSSMNEESICLTLNDLKHIAKFVNSEGHGMKKFQQHEQPHGNKSHKPKTSCNCGKL